MSLDYAILGALAARPLSGYDLKTRYLDQEYRHFWSADQAQVYRTLDKLAAGGLVTSKRERQTSKPDRRVFSVTPLGLEALGEWLAASRPLPPSKEPFLLNLLFASEMSDDAVAGLLSQARDAHQARLEDIRRQISELAQDRGTHARAIALRRMALDGAAAGERAAIDWLDDCLELTARGLPGSPSVRPGSQSQLFSTREKDVTR